MAKRPLSASSLHDLVTLAQFADLSEDARRIQEENCISVEDLRDLVFSVGHYRGEGRINDFQVVVDHAMRIADEFGWRRLLAEFANIQGMNYLIKRQFQEATDLFARATQLWAEEGVHEEQARSLINAAQVYFDTGDGSRAKEVLEKALTLARSHHLIRQEAQILGFIGAIFFYMADRYEEARDYYEQAKELYSEIGDGEGERKIENRLIELKFAASVPESKSIDVNARRLHVREISMEDEIGEFSGGRSQDFTIGAYVSQLERARNENDADLEVDSLSALAYMHGHLGHTQESISYALDALAVAHRTKNFKGQAFCEMTLAHAYHRAGDSDRARGAYLRCLEGAERLLNQRLQGSALVGLGAVEQNYFEKLAYYHRAYEVFRGLGHERGAAVALTNGAIAHFDIAEYHWGDKQEAARENLQNGDRLLDMAMAIWQKLDANNEIASGTGQKARVDFLQGQPALGVGRLQQALSTYQKVRNEAGQVDTLHRLARQYWNHGDHKTAISTLDQAIALIEARFETIVAESIQMPFMGKSGNRYADMIRWCRLERKPADSFQYLERSRSRAFLDLMGDAEIPQPSSLQKSDLGQKETQLRRELRALRLEFARQGESGADLTALWQRYTHINQELNKILDEMAGHSGDVVAYVRRRSRELSHLRSGKLSQRVVASGVGSYSGV